MAKNNYQTSSGERYDQSAPKCAALQWPMGTMLHLVHGGPDHVRCLATIVPPRKSAADTG